MGVLYRGLYACAKVWWRIRRPLTMGVRVLALNDSHEVLLVRHSYLSGWFFPGGGVERGETAAGAAARELAEEAGLLAPPEDLELLGIFANFTEFKNDHIALFMTRRWQVTAPTASAREIVERRFFPLNDLPEAISPGTRRRLDELRKNEVPPPLW